MLGVSYVFSLMCNSTYWQALLELYRNPHLFQRLQSKIIKTVDISYGGENGFNQAIELSEDALSNVKFIQEKKLIGGYFDEIAQVNWVDFQLFGICLHGMWKSSPCFVRGLEKNISYIKSAENSI